MAIAVSKADAGGGAAGKKYRQSLPSTGGVMGPLLLSPGSPDLQLQQQGGDRGEVFTGGQGGRDCLQEARDCLGRGNQPLMKGMNQLAAHTVSGAVPEGSIHKFAGRFRLQTGGKV